MKIPQSILDIIGTAAPTLATALGGPLAGAAAVVASRALGEYFGEPPGQAPPPDKVTPDILATAISANLSSPDLILKLKEAEKDLKEFEAKNEFSFTELEAKDRQSTRDFQAETKIAGDVFTLGKRIILLAYVSLVTLAVIVMLFAFGAFKLPYENREFVTVAFNIITAIITAFTSWAAMVLAYYYGSSRGSDRKTEAITGQLASLGKAAESAIKTAPSVAPAPAPLPMPSPIPPDGKPLPAPSPGSGVAPPVDVGGPTVPTPGTAPEGAWKQGPFGGVRWQVTPDGVLVEGENAVARSPGEPVTVRRIWKNYGEIIMRAARDHSVPAEIIVMTIATESAGQPKARLVEPDKRMSLGLMQILTGTAAEVLGREITPEELQDPELNIKAGTAYIKSQKDKTWFDPILTAASYNAGGLYPLREGKDNNRFHLRSTGDHLERAIRWYGDVCFVAKQDGWFK